VEQGIQAVLDQIPGRKPDIDEIIHGTTLVINAIIERQGGRHRVDHHARIPGCARAGPRVRYDAYEHLRRISQPLVPRRLRREVGERITKRRPVISRLPGGGPTRAVRAVAAARGVESLAVWPDHS